MPAEGALLVVGGATGAVPFLGGSGLEGAAGAVPFLGGSGLEVLEGARGALLVVAAEGAVPFLGGGGRVVLGAGPVLFLDG